MKSKSLEPCSGSPEDVGAALPEESSSPPPYSVNFVRGFRAGGVRFGVRTASVDCSVEKLVGSEDQIKATMSSLRHSVIVTLPVVLSLSGGLLVQGLKVLIV